MTDRETMIAELGRRYPAAADDVDAILAMPRSDAVNEGLLAVIEKAISDVVCSRDDLGHTHFVEIRDAVFAALRAVPSPDIVGVREALKLADRAEGCLNSRTSAYPSDVLRECITFLRVLANSFDKTENGK